MRKIAGYTLISIPFIGLIVFVAYITPWPLLVPVLGVLGLAVIGCGCIYAGVALIMD